MADYTEYPVRGALAELVVCTWIDRPAATRQPVLPDACIDLVWDGARLEVAGPDTRPRPAVVTSPATFVGIRFRPGAAPGLLGVPASELLDQDVGLRDLWGPAADSLAERLAACHLAQAPRLLEDALLARCRLSHGPPDPLIAELLAHLTRRPGPLPPPTGPAADLDGVALDLGGVAELDEAAGELRVLAERLGVSPRTLRRRCVSAVGYGPKLLERVLRFRRAARLIHAQLPLVAAAQQAGYADQAHLSRELQRLGHITPAQLRRRPTIALSRNGYP